MTAARWPTSVYSAPVLRGLDEAGRQRLSAAGELQRFEDGAVVFTPQQVGDAFYVVARGRISIRTTPAGQTEEIEVRAANEGDTFGEEAAFTGRRRQTTAVAQGPAIVAKIPTAIFRRIAGRTGSGQVADQDERFLRRRMTRDLLQALVATRGLPRDAIDALLDGSEHRTVARGTRIYGMGERPDAVYLVSDGLVQLRADDGDRIKVRAFLAAGDLFGESEVLSNATRAEAAVAMGPSELVRIDAALIHRLGAQYPGMLSGLRAHCAERNARQIDAIGGTDEARSSNTFRDLFRLQTATSLLVIDEDACVRCGHCAWTCEAVYGVARVVRRGEKIAARLTSDPKTAPPRSLMLPNSCQHCANPVCMADCPTGAIERHVAGEVSIRENLCTGCGNCAKACPWDNIRIAPRDARADVSPTLMTAPGAQGKSPIEAYPEVAIKCDECRAYTAPACVQSCPTEAIRRISPMNDLVEVAQVLGTGGAVARAPHTGRRIGPASVVAVSALGLAGAAVAAVQQTHGLWTAGRGVGYAAGWVGAVAMFGLMAYSIPKRLPQTWLRRRRPKRPRAPASRSRIRTQLLAHIALGFVCIAAVVAHAGLRIPPNLTGALMALVGATLALGGVGTWVYRALPRRLSRLEHESTLPERLPLERAGLVDRVYRDLSGRPAALKSLAAKLLLPYAKSTTGSLALVLSGRSLEQETRRILSVASARLAAEDRESKEALPALVASCVELRALPARRFLTRWLRGWLPLHIVLGGLSVAAVTAHILFVSLRS